jgi:hypothetical protein
MTPVPFSRSPMVVGAPTKLGRGCLGLSGGESAAGVGLRFLCFVVGGDDLAEE